MLRFAAVDIFWNYPKYYFQSKFSKNVDLPSIANFPNLCSFNANMNEIKIKNDKAIKERLNKLTLDFSNEKNKFNRDYSKFYFIKNDNKGSDEKTLHGAVVVFSITTIIAASSFTAVYIFRKLFLTKYN
jgi:hypothetical protein